VASTTTVLAPHVGEPRQNVSIIVWDSPQQQRLDGAAGTLLAVAWLTDNRSVDAVLVHQCEHVPLAIIDQIVTGIREIVHLGDCLP
jgi:hypothetical protein